MKEIILLALLYMAFYGMTLLDTDLSNFSRKVGVVNIEFVECEPSGRNRSCHSIFVLGDETTKYYVGKDLSSGFGEGGLYFNRNVEVLFTPEDVSKKSGVQYVEHIIRNNYSIYGSTKWLSGDLFFIVTIVCFVIFIRHVIAVLSKKDKIA
ncbi:hypothetical protein [Vibrio coralliilyticus]|uniref:hypothetical protein n=1 Tax=Vibrio coralliilyticus TaxID=190893 RepID=UPI0015619DF2|nr:hypothetical protein [Vibrio coralliilyticus]NRF17451.1 hypothetical protein [Vibrio coralliilyticus]